MALVIEVKVAPQSGKQLWCLDKTGKLKCYLKSPAERGLANQELVKKIAKDTRVPQTKITIIAGATSRTKLIKIDHLITLSQALALFGIEQQMSIK